MNFNPYTPRHKYNAKRTEIDGIKFGSKKEARYYQQLKILKRNGEVVFFLRQVPFHLSGGSGVRYVCDFQVFWRDGTVTFVEVKGFETKTWKIKKRLVEAEYPIKLTIV
ncbi:MAG: DUF1064 domain-containing protein [Candidatus Neomarinimicrobiota bacterium]